jgi:hypothetical protein
MGDVLTFIARLLPSDPCYEDPPQYLETEKENETN